MPDDAGGEWDPLRELHREMGRLLESLQPLQGWRFMRPFPPLNLYDAGDHYLLTAELPGLASEDVALALTGDSLTLRGERRPDPAIRDEAYRRQERPFGVWTRTFALPTRVRPEAVEATLRRGVLTVVLPKAEEVRARQIPVTMAPE